MTPELTPLRLGRLQEAVCQVFPRPNLNRELLWPNGNIKSGSLGNFASTPNEKTKL